MEEAIRRTVDNVLTDALKQPMALTGPICFGESVNVALGREVSTRFDDGDHLVNGLSFRLLSKGHTKHRDQHSVVDGSRTLFMCKYVGYESDLRAVGLEHWQSNVAREKRVHISHWYGALVRRFRRLRNRVS